MDGFAPLTATSISSCVGSAEPILRRVGAASPSARSYEYRIHSRVRKSRTALHDMAGACTIDSGQAESLRYEPRQLEAHIHLTDEMA